MLNGLIDGAQKELAEERARKFIEDNLKNINPQK